MLAARGRSFRFPLVWGTVLTASVLAAYPGARRETWRALGSAGRWVRARLPLAAGQRTRDTAARPPAVVYRKITRAEVPMHVVQVDPARPEVRLAVATSGQGIGFPDSWSAMIERTGPAAAVTGTYFCRRSCLPVGSIVAGGRTIHSGFVGTGFGFRPGRAEIVACRPGSGHDWSRFETALRAGPRLLTGGRITLAPRHEGFRDPAITAVKRRTAIALTRGGKLLLVAVTKPVSLQRLAMALRRAGAVEAMCLDGGGSTGFFYGGRTRVKPGRPLTNLLVVYDSPARYRQFRNALNPAGTQVARSLEARAR